MGSTKNALEELANDLGNIDEGPSPESVCKARRIISELAKIEEAEEFLLEKYDAETARRIVHQIKGNTILKCRAIAKEGANDGKQ